MTATYKSNGLPRAGLMSTSRFNRFCYRVMPFSLKNAGATYQRAMTYIFEDLLHDAVECYVDDLVVKTKFRLHHITDLDWAFLQLRRYNLKMNPLKCAFGISSGRFPQIYHPTKGNRDRF